MNGKKIIWTFGASALLAAPAVLAQAFLTSPWMYFGINTLIVWGILFLLAKLLATELTKSENIGVHAAIFAIAAVISWNLVGGGGFIWQVGILAPFFHMMFFVNTVFLTLVIYYGLRLMGMEVNSKEGTTGMWVMCIMVGGIISSSMSYYFWQAGTFKDLLDLAFGQYGILTMRESRLIVFVTSTMLGFWLLSDLQIGGRDTTASKFINWGFPVIIAANLASSPNPVSTNTVIWMGYFISMFIIGKGMWTQSRAI